MRFIIIFIITGMALCVFAFNAKKCDHIYVSVEQAEVKINQSATGTSSFEYILPSWRSGKHDGKELVCVKCFNVVRQILDYGESTFGSNNIGIGYGSIKVDTCRNIGSPTKHF